MRSSSDEAEATKADLRTRLQTLYRASAVDVEYILKLMVNNLRTMMEDRGYRVDPCDDERQLLARLANGEPALSGTTANGARVGAHMLLEERIAVRSLRSIMESTTNDLLILVSPDGPTPFTRKESDASWPNRVQYFTYREMCMNPARHVLTPTHELATDWTGATEHLPKIAHTDAMVRYYDYPIGGVVRITRTHGHCEPYHYFRVVVPASAL